MARRQNKSRRPIRPQPPSSMQRLVGSYAAAVNIAPQVFLASTLGIVNNRPAVVRSIRVTYSRILTNAAPTTAIGFGMVLHSATGEEVFASPPLLPANATKTFTMRAPASTDFGTFNANGPVITFNNAVGLQVTLKVSVDYKNQPIQVLV